MNKGQYRYKFRNNSDFLTWIDYTIHTPQFTYCARFVHYYLIPDFSLIIIHVLSMILSLWARTMIQPVSTNQPAITDRILHLHEQKQLHELFVGTLMTQTVKTVQNLLRKLENREGKNVFPTPWGMLKLWNEQHSVGLNEGRGWSRGAIYWSLSEVVKFCGFKYFPT